MISIRFAPLAALLLAAALLAGCLPSDQRNLSRDLFPADSLSRQIAEATAEDTLAVVWRVEAPPDVRYPLTVAWAGDRIVMADAQVGAVHSFAASGAYLGAFRDDALEFPFLAGLRGDTVAVLSRGRQRVHHVALDPAGGGRVVGTLVVPDGRNAFAAWTTGGTFVKLADAERGSRIVRLEEGASGATPEDDHLLDGPFWRHIGFMRAWGDTLVSFSGYRPVVDVLPLDAPAGASPDSLLLRGFDSPQLSRSRHFAMGNIKEPPLLVPAGAAVGSRLFVLNARAGWVHVDVFRRSAGGLLLERSLLSPHAAIGRNFFAADLAVQEVDGGYDLVVLESRPQPALVRYRWRP
jgi:hypothetical protein